MKSITLALRIWFLTNIVFGAGWFIYMLIDDFSVAWTVAPALIASSIGSLPVLVILAVILPIIEKIVPSKIQKKIALIIVCAILCSVYGVTAGVISGYNYDKILQVAAISAGVLFACVFFLQLRFQANNLIHILKQINQH